MLKNFTSIIFLGIITCVIIIVIAVYYVMYKRSINKAFREGSPLKKTLPSISTTTLLSWFILWIVSSSVMLYQIQTISLSNNTLENKLNAAEKRISEQLSETKSDILNRTENTLYTLNTRSLIYDYTFRDGAFYADDNTTDVVISVLPKTAGKNDILKFKIGNAETVLKRDKNGYYTGILRISIFEHYLGGIFTMESEGRVFYESVWKNNSLTDKGWTKYFPYINSQGVGMNEDSGKAHMEIYAYPSKSDNSRKFSRMDIEYVINGKTIGKTDLMNNSAVKKEKIDNGLYYIVDEKINGSFQKDDIKFYVNAVDTKGCTYRIMIWYNKDMNYSKVSDSSYIKNNKGDIIVRFNGLGDYTEETLMISYSDE